MLENVNYHNFAQIYPFLRPNHWLEYVLYTEHIVSAAVLRVSLCMHCKGSEFSALDGVRVYLFLTEFRLFFRTYSVNHIVATVPPYLRPIAWLYVGKYAGPCK